jgi:flagellar motor protein MotB
MRAQRPISREEEEEESVFVPMTDMVVSFLFIMMLLLAFFAVKYSTQDKVPKQDLIAAQQAFKAAEEKIAILKADIKELEADIFDLEQLIKKLQDQLTSKDAEIAKLERDIGDRDARIKELEEELARLMKDRSNPLELYVQSSREARENILKQIEAQLREEFQSIFTEQNILVEVKGDALRFKGQGLFADGSDQLIGDRLRIVRRLGDITLNAVKCYTKNSTQTEYASCNPNGVVVEAIQIEGHTDARGSNDENLGLSTRRANSAFFAMQTERTDILDFTNLIGQPVASVAGYGEMRPTAPDTPENRSENRRIDLRIIMYTPGSVAEVRSIQEDIRKNLIGEP